MEAGPRGHSVNRNTTGWTEGRIREQVERATSPPIDASDKVCDSDPAAAGQ